MESRRTTLPQRAQTIEIMKTTWRDEDVPMRERTS
jgi:hypothetical protein